MAGSYSPLRYPGGKGKLAPSIAKLITDNRLVGGHYAEPYAGGAAVGLYLLFNEYISVFHLNDLDPAIFAFWQTLFSKPDWLCSEIAKVKVTPEEWKIQRKVHSNASDYSPEELGFATFFLNRTNRSGIIKSGGMIGGVNQEGFWKLDARFNKATLINRIELIAAYACRFKVTNLDAEAFMATEAKSLPEKALVYLDPPYFVKGSALYENHYKPADHLRLSKRIISDVSAKWLISYDAHPEIITMYKSRRSLVYGLRYQAASNYLGSEILVFSDNLWLSRPASKIFPKVLAD